MRPRGDLPGFLALCVLWGLVALVLPVVYASLWPGAESKWGSVETWGRNPYLGEYRPAVTSLFLRSFRVVRSPGSVVAVAAFLLGLYLVQVRLSRSRARLLLLTIGGVLLAASIGAAILPFALTLEPTGR